MIGTIVSIACLVFSCRTAVAASCAPLFSPAVPDFGAFVLYRGRSAIAWDSSNIFPESFRLNFYKDLQRHFHLGTAEGEMQDAQILFSPRNNSYQLVRRLRTDPFDCEKAQLPIVSTVPEDIKSDLNYLARYGELMAAQLRKTHGNNIRLDLIRVRIEDPFVTTKWLHCDGNTMMARASVNLSVTDQAGILWVSHEETPLPITAYEKTAIQQLPLGWTLLFSGETWHGPPVQVLGRVSALLDFVPGD